MTSVPMLLPDWLNPENLLATLGPYAFWGAVFIIFAECGLLIGFFLPGDSLIFVVGLLIAQGSIDMNIWLAAVILSAAAILGNMTGYWIGAKAGPSLLDRPDSRFFKKEYVDQTHAFFEKYGTRAIVQARFVPIVRTFITAVAGVAAMDYRKYVTFSAIGGVLWAGGLVLAGYFLGNVPFVKNNLELVLIAVVVISAIPIAVEVIRSRRNADEAPAEQT